VYNPNKTADDDDPFGPGAIRPIPLTQPAATAPTDPRMAANNSGGPQPKEADAKGADEGMDMVRKPPTKGGTGSPAPGGTEEGMDARRPAAVAAPVGPEPETLDPAAAKSWDMMKQLAEGRGKESFAVLRLDEFKKANPGKHDAEIDASIDRKMDRLWWERIDQLVRRMERLNVEMPKIRLELADVNDPAVKKKMIESFKKMEADLAQANKTLREQMGYAEAGPPNLGSEAELAALAQKRDKGKFEGWKKATLFHIKSNQGRLPWAGEG